MHGGWIGMQYDSSPCTVDVHGVGGYCHDIIGTIGRYLGTYVREFAHDGRGVGLTSRAPS